MPLEVAGQSPVAADPSESALDDPTLGQDDEPMAVAAADDLDLARASRPACSRTAT
jgi:hypothetical protein